MFDREPLESTDRDRLVELAPAAGRFARRREIQPHTDGNGLPRPRRHRHRHIAPRPPGRLPTCVRAGGTGGLAGSILEPWAWGRRSAGPARWCPLCHEAIPSNGETLVRLSDSRVTDDSGIQVLAGDLTGRVTGPCRGASGVGPAVVVSVITATGHSRTQIVQPTHSPTWIGCSISHGIGPTPGEASGPGACGRDMSRLTGQTSMQVPQLMQLP